jgi:hypothetical protein
MCAMTRTSTLAILLAAGTLAAVAAQPAEPKVVDVEKLADSLTWADLDEYAKYNSAFLAWVTAAMKSGKTADAAAAEYTIPAAYKGYTPNADQTKSNVAVIYKELAK